MKFKSDIEVQAGLKDSSGAAGTSGQVLSSNGTTVSWINSGGGFANDVQNTVKAGVAINKGQAVYVTGADGTNIIVGLASNATEATSSKTLGLLNATVAINGFADVIQIGKLAGLDTSTAVVGDPVWLGSNGNLIYGLANKPYAPLHLVYIGVVTRVNANNGEIFINVQNGFELKEIHDVDIVSTPPSNNEILAFEGGSVNLWKNKSISSIGGITGTGTTNYIPKFTGASAIGNSLIYDNGTSVGIGTASPSTKLEVNSGTSTGPTLRLATTGISVASNTLIGEIDFYNSDATTPGARSASYIQSFSAGTSGGGDLRFGVSANAATVSEAMRITSTGNVGIGQSSPFNKLTIEYPSAVVGNTSADGVAFQTSNTGDYIQFLTNLGNYSSIQAGIRGSITGRNLLLNPSGGNVGIGITTVPNTLSVGMASSTTGKGISLTSSAGIEYARFGVINSTVDNTSFIGSISNNNFAIYANNAERMRITSGGNLLIGTSTDSGNKLEVNGSVRFTNGTNPYLALYDGTSTSYLQVSGGNLDVRVGGANAITFNANSAERMRITSAGNVGIGTSSPVTALHILRNSSTVNPLTPTNTSSIIIQNTYGSTSNSGSALFFESDTGTNNLFAGVAGNMEGSTATGSWGHLTFGTKAAAADTTLTERMRITDTGRVGIGTLSPLTVLQAESANTAVDSVGNAFISTNNTLAADIGGQLTLGGLYNSSARYAFGGIAGRKENATTGNVAGYLTLMTTTSAGALSERMRIFSNGNVGIGTGSTNAGYKLNVNGDFLANTYAKSYTGNVNSDNYFEKVFPDAIAFTNGVANLAADIRLGNLSFWGYIEVEITATYSNQNSAGKLTKVFAVGTNPTNTIYTNESRVVDAMGTIPDNIAIGDMSWDATNTTYRIPISHIVSSGNNYTVKVRMFTHSSGAWAVFNAMTISGTYTLTALPRQYVYYNSNLGIGTTTPNARLDVNNSSSNEIASFIGSSGVVPYKILNNVNVGEYWRGIFTGQNIITNATTGKPALRTGGYTGSAIAYSADSSQGYLGFFTTTSTTANTDLSERMRIFPDGNVGINVGNTNAGYKLDVNGTARVQTSLISPAIGANATPNSTYPVVIGCTSGANGIKIIGRSDNLGYIEFFNSNGTTVNSSINGSTGGLQITGATTFSSSVTAVGNIQTSGYFNSNNIYLGKGSDLFTGGSANDGGLMVSGSNNLIFGNALTERMRITSSGSVGIGTSGSPVSKLQINSGWGNAPITSNRMLQMDLGDVSDYQQHVILLHPIYDATLINYNFCTGTIYSARGSSVSGRISDNYNVDTASAYNSTSGTVNSTGQFGKLYTCTYNGVKYIALMPFYRTSAVGYNFDGYSSSTGEQLKIVVYRISNTGVVTNSEVYNSLVEFASGPSLYQGDIQTAKSLYANNNVAIGTGTSTTRLTIDNAATSNSNHIDMIGWSSTAKGHVGTFSNALYLSSNYYYAGAQNADTTTLGQAAIILQAAATTGSYIDFNTGSAGANFPTNRMRVTGGGNVLIGTTTDAGYKLDVNGTGRFVGNCNLNAGLQFRYNGVFRGQIIPYNSYGGGSDYSPFFTSETSLAFGVNGNATKAFNLASTGAATFTSTVTATGFFNSSDNRLKDLIDYDYNVSDIKPITYLWKDSRDNKKHVGYSAQEVQKVMPDAVNEDADGMLSVNYIEVLVAKIEELENRIKQLEK